jgi:hypothetical protein
MVCILALFDLATVLATFQKILGDFFQTIWSPCPSDMQRPNSHILDKPVNKVLPESKQLTQKKRNVL